MEQKFIKYKEGQINLARLYRSSGAYDTLNSEDVKAGTLVVGYAGDGKYLAMGYLRGIAQSRDNGAVLFEIANAIEGQEYLTCIEKPCKANFSMLPYMVACKDSFSTPVIGKIVKCNGELVVMYDGNTTEVSVNSIYTLEPYFKEKE